MQWLIYVLLTVVTWGLYGIFLHSGQMAMKDAAFGRYKAYLFVGVAYFIFAVLAPLVLLKVQGSKAPTGISPAAASGFPSLPASSARSGHSASCSPSAPAARRRW
jgi:hypothetical protein